MAKSDVWTLTFNNAAQQTRQSPIITPAAGITLFEVALTRVDLDPAIVLTWSIEVSRNGGTTWLPWGAAGTTGGVLLDKQGNVLVESNFTVFLDDPADAQTRVRATLTNTSARMTTTITIRGDTTPIQARAAPPDHHSVLYDNFKEVHGAGVTTLTTASFTITSATNRAALLLAILNGSVTNTTSSCGGVSGALVTGTDGFASGGNGGSLIHAVKNPASGTQTATLSWTTATGASIGVMTASGVDQTTPATNGNKATTSSATPSVTVTTAVGDLTAACGWPANSFASPTQTSLWLDGVTTGGGGSRGPGTGTSDVHSWTQSAGNWHCSGCNLVAAAAGGDTKISALPAASAVVGANELMINEVDTSKKITATQLATFAAPTTAADDTTLGILEIAIQSEQETATDVVRAVTPGRQHFHPSAAKFWVKATGNSTTIVVSYNMTSWADTNPGDADGTIATDFSGASWCGHMSILDSTLAWDATYTECCGFNAQAATSFGVLCSKLADGTTTIATLEDPDSWHIVGWGDQ